MVTTNSLLVGSDITKLYIFPTSNKNIESRKYRHTSLPMLFPCIFEISTHMGLLEDTNKKRLTTNSFSRREFRLLFFVVFL